MKAVLTIGLLILSNTFMIIAWYGHLKFSEWKWFSKLGLLSIILISWAIALFEYMFQVPANRIGFNENGGPFTLIQLKVIQEVITLAVFAGFTLLVFKTETFRINHIISFIFLILAVYFMFKKLLLALVFSTGTVLWSVTSYADGHCEGSTMSDGHTGGKYPQQYELSEYQSTASCKMMFSENPNIVRVYEKYKDKGLVIIGVSLDKPGQKDRWQKAIEATILFK